MSPMQLFKLSVGGLLLFGTVAVHAQALPVYTSPVSKLGGALASGITQTLVRRGFAANDPRIFQTIQSVGARVIPLATAAGSGASWIGLASRLSPWVMGGVLVYEGLKWYFNADGTVSTVSTPTGSASGGVTAGGACFYVSGSGSAYCGSTPTEAVTSYILSTTVYTDLTTINMTAEPSGTSAYSSGRRYYPVTIAGHRNGDLNTIWQGSSSYSVYLGTSTATCPAGFVANGTQCVPNQLSKYIPASTTQTGQTLQVAYNNLPQPVKDADLNPEVAAELANRIWRDAAGQPGYQGVPWSANDPVAGPDLAPQRTAHPTDWPRTSELASTVPTAQTPIVSPTTNPNQTTAPSTAVQIDLGPDPGVQAPTLEDTPTDLFKPIKDLLQPWLTWTVPSHSGQCPTWQASPVIAGRAFVIDIQSHCALADQYRSLIYAAALAGWVILAAFIVLSA